jgi:type I thyroxine 5'-deiodinase
VRRLAHRYQGKADFLTVYIREAHPEDEWQMTSNEKENVCYAQPKTLAQRLAIANDFVKRFHYDVPLVVDPIENPANAAYAGWPERFYIIEESGKIVYKGKPGPFGYHPEEVESWLARRFPAQDSKLRTEN